MAWPGHADFFFDFCIKYMCGKGYAVCMLTHTGTYSYSLFTHRHRLSKDTKTSSFHTKSADFASSIGLLSKLYILIPSHTFNYTAIHIEISGIQNY